jgi:Protein of unknown function (DUF2934)
LPKKETDMRTTARSAAPTPAAPSEPPEGDPALAAEAGPQDDFAPAGEPDDDAHRRRIAERAYRLAEQRGFAPGSELDDWLAAEAQERDDGDR